MKTYLIFLGHGYEILKTLVTAESREEAERMAVNKEWDDVIDEESTDELTVGYKVIETVELDD